MEALVLHVSPLKAALSSSALPRILAKGMLMINYRNSNGNLKASQPHTQNLSPEVALSFDSLYEALRKRHDADLIFLVSWAWWLSFVLEPLQVVLRSSRTYTVQL